VENEAYAPDSRGGKYELIVIVQRNLKSSPHLSILHTHVYE